MLVVCAGHGHRGRQDLRRRRGARRAPPAGPHRVGPQAGAVASTPPTDRPARRRRARRRHRRAGRRRVPAAPHLRACRWRRRWPPPRWAARSDADDAASTSCAGRTRPRRALGRARRRPAVAASPSTATASTSPRPSRADRVVLVADAGLGTINAVSLSVAPFARARARPVVVLNRYDPDDDLHRRNRTWLRSAPAARWSPTPSPWPTSCWAERCASRR